MSGDRFGRWVLSGPTFRRGTNTYVNAICDCGVERVVVLGNLVSGKSTSCGCHRNETHTTHNKSTTRTYRIWQLMKNRCRVKSIGNERYWGRGISVCAQWSLSFESFLADMGECPGKAYSIDRIDNDGNYEPGNCRWATSKEQTRNTRRNVIVVYNGESMCLTDWAQRLGFSHAMLSHRLKIMTIEAAMTTPRRRCTPQDVKNGSVFETIRQALGGKS